MPPTSPSPDPSTGPDPSPGPGAPKSGHRTPNRRTVLTAAAVGAAAVGAAAAPALLGLTAPASAAPARDTPRDAKDLPGGGDLGPNVIVFDPSTAGIQAKLDEIFAQQESAQFGEGRYALLFKPGSYSGLNAQLGFYTSIAGLGLSPDDTTINGDVTVDAGWFDGNATQNFWRSAENLALVPVSGTNRWAVSQAAPFRRMHVRGGLNLAPDGYGWASGGYIADSRIDGEVGPYSQQQWYTRDSAVGGWQNAVWNMVFSGVEGAPAQSFPDPPYTTLETTPVSREKPFLYLDGGEYRVFLPEKRTDARGVTWGNGTPRGTSLPLSEFYVAKPSDTAATLNQALEQGLHLLLTPGVYRLDEPVSVERAGTVVLGLGYATLIPEGGAAAMEVADVDGVRLAGFLIDAGPDNSETLLEVGPEGASADHAADPITVQDVFVRIGGAGPGKATTSIVVNSRHTIIDHTWVWRADHGDGVGWETNRADYGVVVNGDDILATGLFVEHFNKYDVQWFGQRGRTIFFQNEKAYDAPDQAAIQNGSIKGFAAYRVGDEVTSHEGWGLGSYCFYNVDPTIVQHHGFAAPDNAGVTFHDLLVVSLGGKGQYERVINDTGSPTSGDTTTPSTVVSYP
ncbi:coagulation factor 5/8 type domain-containing protein [Streptomyces tubbatahanensis]|uniref:Coagulation factor 5/8 type domain-containing protein n=1 Tax=Streptomyces tubbatahanensis TaxID=2923272 RepID=A0ABY3XVR0_9ACTN|nr:coagulation factor 5/8 type domain-containing protein [Streptomyces tubbatahanensis]UNS98420.1 coagulation factor 5/8 type domain-containing protein [Streptomyces tubbatahanensis]